MIKKSNAIRLLVKGDQMKVQFNTKFLAALGTALWTWHLFAPNSLGGNLNYFTQDFKFSYLLDGLIWDATIFILLGLIISMTIPNQRILWLELGLITSYFGKLVVFFIQDLSIQTWVLFGGFLCYLAHFVLSTDIKLFFRKGNELVDRIISYVALIPLALLIISWALPFTKTTYQTNGQMTFKGTGTDTFIETCCTAFETGWQNNVIAIFRFVSILFFLLLIILGFNISKTVFIPALYFSTYSVAIWISGWGQQPAEPFSEWTQELIDKYLLTIKVTGMLGGFLYTFALIALFVIFLFPSVISDRKKISD
ncbi:hypothetical protein [Candidatus Planktophila limnetica]|nr:hypothetical protein [Candidatus Planktophila limnetica]